MQVKKVGLVVKMIMSLLGFAQLFCVISATAGQRRPVQQRRVQPVSRPMVASRGPVARGTAGPKVAMRRTPQQQTADFSQEIKNIVTGSGSDDSKLAALMRRIPAPVGVTARSVPAAGITEMEAEDVDQEEVPATVQTRQIKAEQVGLSDQEAKDLQQEIANVKPNTAKIAGTLNKKIMVSMSLVSSILAYYATNNNKKEVEKWSKSLEALKTAQQNLMHKLTSLSKQDFKNIDNVATASMKEAYAIQDAGAAAAVVKAVDEMKQSTANPVANNEPPSGVEYVGEPLEL